MPTIIPVSLAEISKQSYPEIVVELNCPKINSYGIMQATGRHQSIHVKG